MAHEETIEDLKAKLSRRDSTIRNLKNMLSDRHCDVCSECDGDGCEECDQEGYHP